MDPADTENSSDSDDDFEDALNTLKADGELIELTSAIAEVNVAISLFFNNQFIEAKKLTAERSLTSMYHSIGYSTMLFLEAAMTFDTKDISAALASIKTSIRVCNRYRKKQNIAVSLGKMLGISSQTEVTEEECHAELIFAELNLFRAILTFLQDENLISFIRGALKIRLCHQTYTYCNKMVEKMNDTDNNKHFLGGVLLGTGTFNITLSLLPPSIISLLEWIGFTSDKAKGLEQLVRCYAEKNLRSSIVSLFILTYNLFLTVHLGTHDADLTLTEKILREMLSKFPKGVFFHLYAGRLYQLEGKFDEAIEHLTEATTLQKQWKQFSHICYWELMWCHAFKMQWKEAARYGELLRLENNWSKCVYTYTQACFLIMDDAEKNRTQINELMNKVSTLKQRFAGKSIPVEKFVARKARKYFEQGEYLLLPAHEMMYIWNGLLMLKENTDVRLNHLNLISQALGQLEERKKSWSSSSGKDFHYFDDYCLVQLLKGACLRYNGEPLKAELCLTDVKENYKAIKKDHYLAPAALSDLAWMLIEQNRYSDASAHLKHIRKNYSHYSLESRLNFRIHAAQTRLDQLAANSLDTSF